MESFIIYMITVIHPLTTFSSPLSFHNRMAMVSAATTLTSIPCFDHFKNCYNKRILFRKTHSGFSSISRCRFYCESKIEKEEEKKVKRCSPYLEKALLKSNGELVPDEWKAVPDIWRTSAEKYGDRVALVDPYHDPPTNFTYNQLEQEILNFSEGLRVIGVKPNEKVALFADNSCRWLVADQGIMAMGAINVARGSRSSVEELLQIYNHSESVALVVDSPELFNRIAETLCSNAIVNLGRESRRALHDSDDAWQRYVYETISSDDVATVIYTSGTTGNPKGVMLTHKNLLHQINNLLDVFPAEPGDRFLSMLPPWHVYERTCEYYIMTLGVDGIQKQISRSSTIHKLVALTFIRVSLAYMEFKRIYEGTFLTRIQKQPSYLISLLDCLWARIMAAILLPVHMLAKNLFYHKIHLAIGISKAGISAGGSLPMHVDKFFEAIGVKLQNGYGMTESSPVTAVRRPTCNVLGSIGHPIRHTEFKVVDAETDEALPDGSKGIVKVRGPQVMKGYYKNPWATKQVLDEEGWLNTGDIGWIAPHHSIGRSRQCSGVVVLEGRAKDTIVLSTGENIEPSEIEEAAMRSALIQQIIVIGQDQRRLGAIIVPNKEEVLLAAKKLSIIDANTSELKKEQMASMLDEELRNWTSSCSFKVGPILIVDEPFTIESGLMTPTMKIRRDRVMDQYREQIANLYK